VKKLLLLSLLLPFTLFFVVGCGKFVGFKTGDRVLYGTAAKQLIIGTGTDETVKVNVNGDKISQWFVRKTKNTVTFRSYKFTDLGGEDIIIPKDDIIWIEKHPDQIPMPSLAK